MSNPNTSEQVARLIEQECDSIKALLLAKNRAYGNSALDPVRIFSKSDPTEQIRVRIDDKLSRLSRGSSAGEDVEQDLLGYLVLLRVARKLEVVAPLDPGDLPDGFDPLILSHRRGVALVCPGAGERLGAPVE